MNEGTEWNLLSALADGELDDGARRRLVDTMSHDVRLQARYRRLEFPRAWTRPGATRHRAPRTLRRRIRCARPQPRRTGLAHRARAAWQRWLSQARS